MTKVSDQVKQLEDELAKYKGAVRGSCALRNRDGYEKPFTASAHYGPGSAFTPEPLRYLKFWERRHHPSYDWNGESMGFVTREVTYHYTGEQDAFGRLVYQEV